MTLELVGAVQLAFIHKWLWPCHQNTNWRLIYFGTKCLHSTMGASNNGYCRQTAMDSPLLQCGRARVAISFKEDDSASKC